jgi:hypothetical protein
MTRESFQDIVPPKRSIRNITNDRIRRPVRAVREEEEEEEQSSEIFEEPPRMRRSSHLALWLIAGVSFVVLSLAAALLFSGAKVTVVPKQQPVFIEAQFESFRNDTTIPSGELSHEIMTIDAEATQTVPATTEEEAADRASGTIIVYNNFSSASQRLITNTRFETPDGLIYRIGEPVVVPGQRTVEGKTVPGSIEATVYADEPGESYNINLTDFTIPGFKGSPRYDGFYARSMTPMTGGFIGTRLAVDETTLAQARKTIEGSLREELLAKAFSQKPEGFYLFENGITIAYTQLPNEDAANSVTIKEKGALSGILFSKEDFDARVAKNTVAGIAEEDWVTLVNTEGLSFSLLGDETAPAQAERISFLISGNAHVVWQFDAEKLVSDLAGRSKEALQTVLSGYPSIEEAQVVLRPFWKQTFPEDPEKIDIVTTITAE